MTLLELVVTILTYALLVWLVGLLPVPDPFPKVAVIVLTVAFAVRVLYGSGVLAQLGGL